jgi:hypothetical protein
MASNQERYFRPTPILGDSSKLRFSQAYEFFNVNLFNQAAKSDKAVSNFILNLKRLTEKQLDRNKRLSIAPLLIKARANFPLIRPRAIRLQPSPNAPNTAPAFSLVAA